MDVRTKRASDREPESTSLLHRVGRRPGLEVQLLTYPKLYDLGILVLSYFSIGSSKLVLLELSICFQVSSSQPEPSNAAISNYCIDLCIQFTIQFTAKGPIFILQFRINRSSLTCHSTLVVVRDSSPCNRIRTSTHCQARLNYEICDVYSASSSAPAK